MKRKPAMNRTRPFGCLHREQIGDFSLSDLAEIAHRGFGYGEGPRALRGRLFGSKKVREMPALFCSIAFRIAFRASFFLFPDQLPQVAVKRLDGRRKLAFLTLPLGLKQLTRHTYGRRGRPFSESVRMSRYRDDGSL